VKLFFFGKQLHKQLSCFGKVFGKIASTTAHEGESWNKLLFLASSQFMFL
jgi:hypothetical protein